MDNMFLKMLKQFRKPEPGSQSYLSYKMTFSFTEDYPDTAYENPMDDRVIGKRAKANIYAINAGSVREADKIGMMKAKEHLVEMAVSNAISSPGEAFKNASFIKEAAGIAEKYAGLSSTVLAKAVAHDVFGYGPLSLILEDKENIEEIVVNGPTSNICVYHSKYGFCITNMKFNSEANARFNINRMLSAADKELNDANPVVDARVALDARMHAQTQPYSANGIMASIRIAHTKGLGIASLLKNNTVNDVQAAYIWIAIEAGLNVLISGAPASGKTTLMNALKSFMPRYERIVSIEEEANEVDFQSNFTNAVYLIGKKSGRVGFQEQVANALRLRPDRLVIGEIRGSEAKDVFFGSNTGVPFMATMHSNSSGLSVIARLQSKPMSVDEELIANLDIVIFMEIGENLSRRLAAIDDYFWLQRAEIDPGTAQSKVEIKRQFDHATFDKSALKRSKAIIRYAIKNGISPTEALAEFVKRAKFIKEAMKRDPSTLEKQITDYWS